MSCSGGLNGTYRVDEFTFPSPITSWQDSIIAQGLDRRPRQSSYAVHAWNWQSLTPEEFLPLYTLYKRQKDGTPIGILETDPYDIEQALSNYGTVQYTNVVMQNFPKTRGMPQYEDITITFLVYVGGL